MVTVRRQRALEAQYNSGNNQRENNINKNLCPLRRTTRGLSVKQLHKALPSAPSALNGFSYRDTVKAGQYSEYAPCTAACSVLNRVQIDR